MWKRSFVATTVAIGGTVDDALQALASPIDGAAGALVQALSASSPSQRAARAVALANAVRDIMLEIDEATLR